MLIWISTSLYCQLKLWWKNKHADRFTKGAPPSPSYTHTHTHLMLFSVCCHVIFSSTHIAVTGTWVMLIIINKLHEHGTWNYEPTVPFRTTLFVRVIHWNLQLVWKGERWRETHTETLWAFKENRSPIKKI